MTRREALYELLEELTDEEVEALWTRLEGELDTGPLRARSVLKARQYPILGQISVGLVRNKPQSKKLAALCEAIRTS